jgi:glycine/D-amino acid oxidase-like deaminating enzyme
LKNTYIFNGLGAKGVTQSPLFAKYMTNLILDNTPLPPEIDITRIKTKK